MVKSQVTSPSPPVPKEPVISGFLRAEGRVHLTLVRATLQCAQEGLLWGPEDKVSYENSSFTLSP